MFCVAYRFHPLEEDHTAFIACWKEMTQLIERELGGLGSRLHLTEDGDLYAYAQWPDRASWERMWDAEESGRMAELSSHWRLPAATGLPDRFMKQGIPGSGT